MMYLLDNAGTVETPPRPAARAHRRGRSAVVGWGGMMLGGAMIWGAILAAVIAH